MNTWALQDAKNQLSEVVRRALRDGAQEITVRGEPAVTVIATDELQQLRPHQSNQGNIVDFFLASPLRGAKMPSLSKRNKKDDADNRKVVF